MPQTLIKIPERGTAEISKSLWMTLAADSHFWSLVQRGIISADHPTATTVRLAAGCYVGRAVVAGGIAIELEEKIPGSLLALIRHASRADFRVQPLPSQSSAIGPLISLLADQFADSVSRYLSRGRQFVYRRERQTGALVGGKLHLTGTIRLRARGLRHLAEFEKNAVVFDTPVNRVITRALRELERIHRLMPLDSSTLARARSLALLFSDCRNTEVLFGARSGFIKLAAKYQADSSDSLMRDIMSLAGVLLAHESFEPATHDQGLLPRAWFLNLEGLFEAALRNILARIIGDNGSVRNGRSVPMPIFPEGAIHYGAHPDFVIWSSSPNCVIGDAKFKVPQEKVAPSDLYQILAHASAFAAKDAFLVYPHDSFEVYDLGVAATGTRLWLFKVDVRNLKSSLEQLLSLVLPTIAFDQQLPAVVPLVEAVPTIVVSG
jgi:5-methylcytosine-specific restriction endonuclease McrBC regulatory subunit McrC